MSSIAHQLLGLYCETPLHAGGGAKEAVIDLPVQREAHTGWPCVYGSAMKGALRARAEQLGVEITLIEQAFGPDTLKANDHAGALLVSDARLLLLPVRSLTSHFKWVCCPALLRRLLSDLARTGQGQAQLNVPSVSGEQVLSADAQTQTELYLEEFRFTCQAWPHAEAWLDLLSRVLGDVPGIEPSEQRAMLQRQLVLVDDDSFAHLCRSALPILPHIRINSATKTVEQGALWYEENLPADSVLYTTLSCQPSRKPNHPESAQQVLAQVLTALFEQPYVQIGGNETTGMGWCRVVRWEGC